MRHEREREGEKSGVENGSHQKLGEKDENSTTTQWKGRGGVEGEGGYPASKAGVLT